MKGQKDGGLTEGSLLEGSKGEGDLGGGRAWHALAQRKELQEDRLREPMKLLHKDLVRKGG